MGKIKKLRQKYHLSLKKSKSLSSLQENIDNNGDLNLTKKLFQSSENIFSAININYDDLTKTLPKDYDVRSIISTKSRKELKEEERHLKKKDRQKLRHERFLNSKWLTVMPVQTTFLYL